MKDNEIISVCILTQRKTNSGLTLVETLVAAGFFISAIIAILASYVSLIMLNEFSRNITLVNFYARQMVEDVIEQGEQATPFSQPFTLPTDGYPIGKGTIVVEELEDHPDVLDIRVAICWQERNGRIIGEDNGAGGGIALNGILDGQEDANNNGLIDSPAVVQTSLIR